MHRRIQVNLEQTESYMNTSKKLLRSFEWFHDETFTEINTLNKTNRQVAMSNLDDLLTKLELANSSLQSLSEKLNTCEQGGILKRLEWASSSNPSLNEAIKSFEQMRTERNAFYEIENGVFGELKHLIDSWMNFESMHTKKSTQYTDLLASFENMVCTVESLNMLDESTMPKISDVELTLIGFQSFKERKSLTNSIIQEYYKLIYDEVAQMKKQKQKEEKDYVGKLEEINKCCSELKVILNQHNKIMSDIKPLLKTMSKYNDNNQSIINYSKVYQTFSENCQQLVRVLSTVSPTNSMGSFEYNFLNQDALVEIRAKLELLVAIVPKVYEDLMSIKEIPDKKQPNIVDILDKGNSSANTACQANRAPQVKPGKIMQECNSYAIGVWKKIYQKLDGKDSASSERLNVQEQVKKKKNV
jgi:hypothetical protein